MGSTDIVVLIILFYYLFSFDPGLDPFRKGQADGRDSLLPFQENPVDAVILRLMRRNRKVSGQEGLTAAPVVKREPHSKRAAAYIKVCRSLCPFMVNLLRRTLSVFFPRVTFKSSL